MIHTDLDDFSPVDDTDTTGDNGHTDGGADDAVRARHGIVENSGEYEPHAAAEQSAHVAEHEFNFGTLKHDGIEDALAYRPGHFGADEYRAEYLEDGREDTGLLEREHLGADARAERVGHVVGTDAERENECDYEAAHD